MAEQLDCSEIPQTSYKLVTQVGKGAFSRVFLAYTPDFQRRAVKRIRLTTKPHMLLKEIEYLRKLTNKPSIVQLVDIKFSPQTLQTTVITNFLSSDEFKKLLPSFTPKMTQSYMFQLLQGLSHLESVSGGLLHRDVKPGNFMFNATTSQGMLIDFGLAQSQREAKEFAILRTKQAPLNPPLERTKNLPQFINKKQVQTTPIPPQPHSGTHGYRAPEILLPVAYQTPKIDTWSAGVILLQILTSKTSIFRGIPNLDVHEILAIRSIMGADRFVQSMNAIGADFALTAASPQNLAFSIEELSQQYNPELFAAIDFSVFELCRKLLEFDPKKRITASQALQMPFFKRKMAEKTLFNGDFQRSVITQISNLKESDNVVFCLKKRCNDISEIIQISKSMQETLLDDYSKLGGGSLSFQKELIKDIEKNGRKHRLLRGQVTPFGQVIERNVQVFSIDQSQKCELKTVQLSASSSYLVDEKLSEKSIQRANLDNEMRQRAVRNTSVRRRLDAQIQSIKVLIKELLIQQQKVRREAELYRRTLINSKYIHFQQVVIQDNTYRKDIQLEKYENIAQIGKLNINRQLEMNTVRYQAYDVAVPIVEFQSSASEAVHVNSLLKDLTSLSHQLVLKKSAVIQEDFEDKLVHNTTLTKDQFKEYLNLRDSRRKYSQLMLQITQNDTQIEDLKQQKHLIQGQQAFYEKSSSYQQQLIQITASLSDIQEKINSMTFQTNSLYSQLDIITFDHPNLPQIVHKIHPQVENFSDTITLLEEYSGMNPYYSIAEADENISNNDRAIKNQQAKQRQYNNNKIRRNLRTFEHKNAMQQSDTLHRLYDTVSVPIKNMLVDQTPNIIADQETIQSYINQNLQKILNGPSTPLPKCLMRVVLTAFTRQQTSSKLSKILNGKLSLYYANPAQLFANATFEPSMLYSSLQNANISQRNKLRSVLVRLANTCTFYVNSSLARKDLILACQCAGGVPGVPMIAGKDKKQEVHLDEFAEMYPKSFAYVEKIYQQSVKNIVQRPDMLNKAIEELEDAEKAIKARIFEISIEELYQKTKQKWLDDLRTGMREYGPDFVRQMSQGVRNNQEIRNRRQIIKKYVK
ncbi:Kinase, CDC7 [Spironucleus salmonicida]|uniref:non-specific serine/threonine protein kinase n=1 Tax=Spironucleus salmonicida TaxID=348837 RepID=V6LQ33_9EUKA|nr:Kinase, CDC7 [Spironucleus salmonicida]|eukprot:EST45826.1 Kinase, CDC7 [Spironucleus salmonicida]